MKEIKFRGRDKLDDGAFSEWLYGSLDLTEYRPIIRPKGGVPETVMAETIGQFTGLKDANGTEIYEGDVVDFCYYKERLSGLVKYDEECALFAIWIPERSVSIPAFAGCATQKVIGNVFDNPELKERFWTVWNQENNE